MIAAKEMAEEVGSAVRKTAENGIDAIDDVGKGALKSVDEVIETSYVQSSLK